MNLILPTIHPNGTGRETLVADYQRFLGALNSARTGMRDVGPNGRDYYPQGPGALERAQAEHLARMKRLDSIIEEIEAIVVHIADANT